eukprot:3080724-Prymnesium_polylepis.1
MHMRWRLASSTMLRVDGRRVRALSVHQNIRTPYHLTYSQYARFPEKSATPFHAANMRAREQASGASALWTEPASKQQAVRYLLSR